MTRRTFAMMPLLAITGALVVACGGGGGGSKDPATSASSSTTTSSCTDQTIATCDAACKKGDTESCYQQGVAIQYKRLPGGDAEAARLYELACGKKHEFACDNLGVMLMTGAGTPKNVARGMQLFEQSCDVGSPTGCGNLAAYYTKGEDVPQDFVRAFNLLEKRVCTPEASKKDPDAYINGCIQLGMQLAKGAGTAPDVDRGEHMIRTICNAGVKRACDLHAQTFVEAPKK